METKKEKKMIKRLVKIAILSIVILGIICMSLPVLADSYENYITITVTDTTGTDRTNVPVFCGINVSNLASAGYINANGTNTLLKEGSTELEYLLSSNSTFVIPTLAAYQTRTFTLYTGYSTNQTSFEIVLGTNGYLTREDAAAVEPSGNFTYSMNGCFWDNDSSGSFLMYKPGALMCVTDVANNGNFAILNGAFTNIVDANTGSGQAVGNGTITRAGERRDSFNASIITNIYFKLSKVGSPTGTGYIRVRKVSDDSLLGTLGTIDVSTLTGVATDYNISGYVVNPTSQNVRFTFEYSGGNADNCVVMTANNTPATGDLTTYNGVAWTDTAGSNVYYYVYYHPVQVVVSSSITTAEHDYQLICDGINFTVNVDGASVGSTAFVGTVPDSADNWKMMDTGVIYCDNITYSIGGVPTVLYDPATIISGTTMPDRQGTAQDGTITWGSHSGITVTYSGITPYSISLPETSEGLQNTVPTASLPEGWFGDNPVKITQLPAYEQINQAATEMGMDTQTLFLWLQLATATAVGLGVAIFTGSGFIALCACLVVEFAAVNSTITPGWIMFVTAMLGLGFIYLQKQV